MIRPQTFLLQLLLVPLAGILAPLSAVILPFFGAFFALLVWIHPTQAVRSHQVAASLWFIFVMPFFVAGLLAPYRAALLLVARLTGVPANWEAAWLLVPTPLELPVALGGMILSLVGGLYAIAVLRVQRDQTALLPVSSAASAAVGLAAFKGVARRAHHRNPKVEESGDGSIFDPKHLLYERRDWTGKQIKFRRRWSRFYLEDGSGRILVEPHGADFWDGAAAWLFEPLRKIWLTRRIERRDLNPEPEERRFLEEGDPVYVVGNVEIDPEAKPDAADSERLVVRPSTERVPLYALERVLFPEYIGARFRRGRAFRHVFFLTDALDTDVRDLIERNLRATLLMTAVWLASAAYLLVEIFDFA